MVHISQLAIYPVKSLRGFTVNSAVLTPMGLAHDRQWMIINDKNHFITQRKFAEMVLIHTNIRDGQLILSKPSEPELGQFSLAIDTPPDGEAFDAVVWKDTCRVIDEGAEASRWLNSAIHSPSTLRLVRMANTVDSPRPQSNPQLLGIDTHTQFADAAPFLVCNDASLAAVNQQLADNALAPVTMEHFRPNIVLTGLEAFAEHHIQHLHHERYELQHCYPCQRCVVPTIDVKTGIRNAQQQPFSLLADINPMPEKPKAPAFGENAILTRGEQAHMTVGDSLTMIKTD